MIIEAKNVYKKFKNDLVLNNVDFSLKEGSITGIIGRNGSGKTVLLKLIANLYFPSSGTITINSKYDLINDFGYLLDTNFLENETAFNNLYYLSLIKNKINKSDIYKILEYVGLDPFNKKHVSKYSTGMRQKLKLAQSLMEKPKVLILDEPFNGLDKESVEFFRDELRKINKKGVSIIITSHYKEDIDSLCDTVYEMNHGVLKRL